MPYITEARKYGVGLNMYSQTLNKYDRNDLHTILGNVATLTSFAVGYDDARILAPNMFTFTGDSFLSHKEYAGWDLYGRYGRSVRHYSAGEEQRNAINELMNQARQECIIRIKENARTRLWLARVSNSPDYPVSNTDLTNFLKKCAELHYGTSAPVNAEPEDDEPNLWD